MDGASRRAAGSRARKRARNQKRPDRSGGDESAQRRLVQLAVSLILFLLVYIGRGVFPAQWELWKTAAAVNVDFKAVFQQFSSALSQGEPVGETLEALCVQLLGGEVREREKEPQKLQAHEPPQPVALLSQTPGGGLGYLDQQGLLAGDGYLQKGDEPDSGEPAPVQSEAPEPSEPAVVTAVAQEYTDDGVKLPRNVSLAFYELGLSETAVPVNGTATSGFGYREHPISGKNEFHLAIDIGAAEGTEIGAFAAGTVEYIGQSDEFGNYLKIRHENNVSSFYAHCSKLLVHKGDEVACGQTVALVGQTGNATGPHLHLTIEKDNIRLDPAYYVELS